MGGGGGGGLSGAMVLDKLPVPGMSYLFGRVGQGLLLLQ